MKRRAVGFEAKAHPVFHAETVARWNIQAGCSSSERGRRVQSSARFCLQDLGLHEQLAEGGMQRIRERRRQHDLGVARQSRPCAARGCGW